MTFNVLIRVLESDINEYLRMSAACSLCLWLLSAEFDWISLKSFLSIKIFHHTKLNALIICSLCIVIVKNIYQLKTVNWLSVLYSILLNSIYICIYTKYINIYIYIIQYIYLSRNTSATMLLDVSLLLLMTR